MEKQIKKFWVAGFFSPAINATVFTILTLENIRKIPSKTAHNWPKPFFPVLTKVNYRNDKVKYSQSFIK